MEKPSWLTLTLSGLIASLAYFFVKLYMHRRFYRDVPTPPHSFLWGHLKLFGEPMSLLPSGAHYQQVITTISQKYDMPGAWYLDLWPVGPSQLIVTDPDLASFSGTKRANQFTVLKNHPKHIIATTSMDTVLGTGNIATANGPAWKAAHNMIAPAFSVSHQRSMAGMMAEEVMVFRSILQEMAATGEVFEIERVLANLVLNTIARSIFEESLDTQRKETPMLAKFHAACDENIYIMYSWNPVGKLFARWRMNRLSRDVEAQLADMIRVRFEKLQRDNVDVNQKRGLCTMDLILREHLLEVRKTQREALDPAFMHMAITQVRTLLLASSGTTTATLIFAYALLSVHPQVLEKLRREHDTVFCPGVEATYDLLQAEPNRVNELEYTTNVLKEVLRMYPIGNSARMEDATGFLTYKGQQLTTRGQLVTGLQHTMHYDPKLYSNPKKFDPDRFTRDEVPRNAWRPFERGPRACLGQTMAMAEMKLTLLLTVRDFDFECSGLRPTKQRFGWTDLDTVFGDRAFSVFKFEAKPIDGMPMTVRRAV
ncbi:cytochrome P450 3A30 [Karstenula rhodostoma CBS 690.94]|uniref:Cytochrome P450 3A30 n=1 Tax=Karstenula rhodostoma CBS 690.94 TaxID=1392251 RepID=A0A9P4PFX4_9PLEO|nr:cytochrome P450 3A30 [Karstenula rhodostoma CBS 690.94]